MLRVYIAKQPRELPTKVSHPVDVVLDAVKMLVGPLESRQQFGAGQPSCPNTSGEDGALESRQILRGIRVGEHTDRLIDNKYRLRRPKPE